jgi:hypothetical protein
MVNLFQGQNITKALIKNKKLKWCRLMFAIYIKLSNNQFQRVSPPTFSDLIKESTTTENLFLYTIQNFFLCSLWRSINQ